MSTSCRVGSRKVGQENPRPQLDCQCQLYICSPIQASLWFYESQQKNIATAVIRHSLLCHQHCYKRLSNSFTIRTECTELRIKSDVTLLSNPLKATSLHPTSCMVLAPIHSVICPIFLRPLWPLIIYFLSYVQPLFEMNVRVLTENYMHPTYQFSVFLGMPQLSSLASPHQNNFSSVF